MGTSHSMPRVIAGIDLGGTAINYTFVDDQGRFLIAGLCEYPARVADGPDVCLEQIAAGFSQAVVRAGLQVNQLAGVGLATPGPASADGVLSARGSTNFMHPGWAGFDLRGGTAIKLRLPVTYLNDGNAAALWGHSAVLGDRTSASSVTVVIGTGFGGGIVVDGRCVTGTHGFGGELGHVLIPFRQIPGLEDAQPLCNCGRLGDIESLSSLTAISRTLLPRLLRQHPTHDLARSGTLAEAAKLVRGYAQAGDDLGRAIFRMQAQAIALFFDQMINVFDPDALIVGGGAVEASPDFRDWFLGQIRAALPEQRPEQADISIVAMPDGDTAGARGAALAAQQAFRQSASTP